MIARILRVAFALAIAAVVLVLFAYAFLAALIVVPVLALLFFLFGKKYGNVWVVGGAPIRPGESPGDQRHTPPVIDHDPNDLPLRNDDGDRR
ncbi:MAG: hypothetical protein K1X51_06630 [Rhodospirillaceae bacterium]|nr:hypothetical protein [Rhodospirillaceae bacterium]